MKQRQVVFLRYVQSKWNVANRFTGWTDVRLTRAGENETRAAVVSSPRCPATNPPPRS